MVLKIERVSDGQEIVLRLSGRLQAQHVEQLKEQMERTTQSTILDLADVKLIDRDVVCFFGVCEANGTELRHCPAYIREWILKESANS
jgi:hypothetical protein